MSDVSRLRETVERRRRMLNQMTSETPFELCRSIQQAGSVYQNGTLDDVASELDIGYDDARTLVASYIILINYPSDKTNMSSVLYGVEFYQGLKSADEIAESNDESREDVEYAIRKFTAATQYDNSEIHIDLRSESIPESPVYPESFKEAAQSMSQLARSIDVSGIQQAAAQAIDTSALRQVAAQAVDTAQIAAQARQALQPMITQWSRSLAQSPIQRIIEQFQSDVRRAISDGISNFSPPSEYDPESVEVHPFAERVAYSRLESFLDDVSESEELLPYENRLRTALEFHDEGQYHAPIFICISVQDGLMHTLCQLRGVSPSDTSRFGDPIYKWEKKRNTLAGAYEEWYGIPTSELVINLDSFYRHRNSIMHGAVDASFDKNISTISLLFLNMTLYTVLRELDSD